MHFIKSFLKNNKPLRDLAKAEFSRLVETIGEDNVNPLDLNALYEYACLFAEIVETEKLVEAEGEIIYSDRGAPYLNPRMGILLNRKERMARLRRDLNLVPKARMDKTGTKKGSLSQLIGDDE